MSRRFTIGRERSCDVAIADESVSRVHAEIWLGEDGAVMLADRGSSNGTVLLRGGQSFPISQEVVMPADQVRFGSATLSVADVIGAIEARHPGALTPPAAGATPPPLPPNLPPPRPAGGALIRCECGAVKKVGQICPGCHQ